MRLSFACICLDVFKGGQDKLYSEKSVSTTSRKQDNAIATSPNNDAVFWLCYNVSCQSSITPYIQLLQNIYLATTVNALQSVSPSQKKSRSETFESLGN
jgi:hypothetical protein